MKWGFLLYNSFINNVYIACNFRGDYILKVMILSASTGGGHMRASNAIKGYLDNIGDEVVVLDTIEYINPILNKTINESYEYLARKKPNLYRVLYKSGNNKKVAQAIATVNTLISKKLVPLIVNYKPDIVIVTHPFSAEMVSKLKKMGKIDVKILCIITDYAPHRVWINDNVDAYVVSDEKMIKKMYNMGVPYWRVYPFGIPIEDVFYTKRDKSIILKEMGLNPGLPTILIMAGSFGVENILDIYKNILKIPIEFQIIVITGKNKSLYESIEHLVYGNKNKRTNRVLQSLSAYVSNLKTLKFVRRGGKSNSCKEKYSDFEILHKNKTRILYFTSEVDKYMQTADLIITKPGGLTITEALACNLPMAIFDAIPGQEEENADFLVSNNMAIKLYKGDEGANQIKQLLENVGTLESMKLSCETFDKSNSLRNIRSLMQQMCLSGTE